MGGTGAHDIQPPDVRDPREGDVWATPDSTFAAAFEPDGVADDWPWRQIFPPPRATGCYLAYSELPEGLELRFRGREEGR